MKLNKFKTATLATAFLVFLSFNACNDNNPAAPTASQEIALQQSDQLSVNPNNVQQALAKGPVSNELAESIPAPKKRITRKEGELNIVKLETKESLAKRYIASWNVFPWQSGWIYAGEDHDNRTWLYFPYNAVSDPVTITIDWESTGLLEGGVEFSPHGIQFLKPVTVWISYKDVELGNIDEKDLKIWFWNEDSDYWELVGDYVDTEHEMVGGYLNHFSRYALGTE